MLTRLHSRSAFSRSQFSKFIGSTVARLYAASVIGLHSLLSVKATDKSLGNSLTLKDNRQGERQSGIFSGSSHTFSTAGLVVSHSCEPLPVLRIS